MALTAEQRRFLEEPHFAILGTVNPSGSPHLTAMWYLLDGDDIVFNTAAGRAKESNLDRDPRVSILVYDERSGYHYIRIDGRARKIDDPAIGQSDIRRLALRYYRDDARVEEGVRERWSKQRRVSYRVATTRIYDYR